MNGFANAIDFVSIISYWIDLGLMVNGYPNCSVFKALGAARPLRLLSLLPGTAVSDSSDILKKENIRL